MFKKMLVGIDGSEHAMKAAKLAGELARCHGSDLFVVTCFEPIPTYVGAEMMEEVISKRVSDAQTILKPALEMISDVPGQLKTDVLEGQPAEVILSKAQSEGVDLIIMGVRGLGRLTGFLFGSQSQKVVANASCPVLLVR